MDLISVVIWLLIFFQIKHFLADYIFQGRYMLQKFRPDWGFFFPLAAHVSVHAVMTLAILLVFSPGLWYLAFLDLVVHFVMDRIKAGPRYLGRYKPLFGEEFKEAAAIVEDKEVVYYANFIEHIGKNAERRLARSEAVRKLKSNRYYWIGIGLDQMVHHLTHYFIIFAVVMDIIF
jgi:hypothetical protein